MSQENVELTHEIVAALGRRDVERFLELSAPEGEFHSSISVLSEGGAYHGHEGIRQYMSDVDDAFESLEPIIEQTLHVGDLVVVLGSLRYRGRASGVTSEPQFGWVFKFREGKLVYLRAFRDPERALEAVGLSE
jgi:ketosteroid isomerase-like protein